MSTTEGIDGGDLVRITVVGKSLPLTRDSSVGNFKPGGVLQTTLSTLNGSGSLPRSDPKQGTHGLSVFVVNIFIVTYQSSKT